MKSECRVISLLKGYPLRVMCLLWWFYTLMSAKLELCFLESLWPCSKLGLAGREIYLHKIWKVSSCLGLGICTAYQKISVAFIYFNQSLNLSEAHGLYL